MTSNNPIITQMIANSTRRTSATQRRGSTGLGGRLSTVDVHMSAVEGEALKKIGLRGEALLLKINDLDQNFELDFVVQCHWSEEPSPSDSAFSKMKKLVEAPAWVPDIKFYNTVGPPEVMMDPFYYRCGNNYVCQLNWKLVISETLELGNFPFDRQSLYTSVFSTNSTISEYDNKVGLLPEEEDDPPDYSIVGMYHYGECFLTVGAATQSRVRYQFIVLCFATQILFDVAVHVVFLCYLIHIDAFKMDKIQAEFYPGTSRFNFQILLTRNPFFYLFNIVLVNFAIVLISLSVVAIDVTDYASRLGILITSVLTAVAFKFVTGSWVPNVSYLTLLDKYIIFAFVVLSVVVFESFVVALFPDDAYHAATVLDDVIMAIIATVWVLLHVLIAVGARTGWFYIPWERVLEDDNAQSQWVYVKTGEGTKEADKDS